MAIKTRLVLRQTQRLGLTPVMRTALSVLRMSPLELAEEIEREAAHNPFLMLEATASGRERVVSAEDSSLMPDIAAHEASFQESLRRQLGLMTLPASVEAAAMLLVSELRDDGMLDVSLDDLAAETGVDLALLATALAALQRCDPAGVGARSLAESILLQLIDLGLDRASAQATTDNMRLFLAGDWATLARTLGLDRTEAERRAALLRQVSTRPVSETADATPTPLRPDLVAGRGAAGELVLEAERRHLPKVVLDAAMVRRSLESGFAPELLTRARGLVEALENRGQTLSRIGAWLAQNQAGFFAEGPGALRPATQAQMAADLGLHPSTVSRALAGKAVDVDGRLWPLSVFFSASIPTDSGEVSAQAVQRRIADLIGDEPPEKPLSDAALTEKLRAEGVDIARRTVAKYRQGLRIPSAPARRRQAAMRRLR